jgi:hypothetical protein
LRLATGAGKLIEETRDFGEGEIGFGICVLEKFRGDVAEITVFAVGSRKIFVGLAGSRSDDAPEDGATDAEGAFVMFGKNVCGEKAGGEGGILNGKGLEEFRDEAELFEFFGGGGNGVRSLCEGAHGSEAEGG